jgi:hypothetical protein
LGQDREFSEEARGFEKWPGDFEKKVAHFKISRQILGKLAGCEYWETLADIP